MNKEYELKKDGFRKARGGSARLLEIICSNCGKRVLVYQKDGLGFLHRCYLNRIFEPEKYERLQYNPYIKDPKDMPNLICGYCNTVIGTPMRHFDKRLAFHLRPGFFIKKLIKEDKN